MRSPADFPRRLPRASRRVRFGILIGVVVLILVILSLRSLARFWTDYLWFKEVHFTSVFRGVLVTKVLLALVFIGIFFVMMLASLTVADRVAPTIVASGPDDELVNRYREIVSPRGRLVRLFTSLVFALFAGVGANREWNNWDLFRYHLNFTGPNSTDPQYHHNIGFYVFQLPFIKFLLGWFFEAVIVILVVTLVAHYLNGGIRFQAQGQRATPAVKTHVSVILGILALIKGVDYYFQRLELVLSDKHVVNGATATSVHANAPADVILIAIAVIAAGLFLYNIRLKGWTLPIVAVGLWLLVWVLLGGVYPALYQAVRVSPSELTREAPYIQRNIDATQTAYGITPQEVSFTEDYPGNAEINASQIAGTSPQALANQETLANVRLLDPAQVQNTFDKYQALRNYYQFPVLSVDRYDLGSGSLTQVVTSARELNAPGVPSGFVNQHLEYTHGYGVVVAPGSQEGVNSDGTPRFSLSDIPPSGTPPLDSTGSQIYYGYGSQSSGYAVAGSKQPELDYESTNGNQVSTRYQGHGGVAAGSIIRRAAFALRFGDLNMILSGQITPSSRVMYIRNVADRVRKAAPFLKFDADPYAVVLNNRVYWVQDAYTTSANYPYSQVAVTDRLPLSSGLNTRFNYVRNSVKVVVSAYDGSMYFFVMNTGDPIIKVYQHAFPDLLIPVSRAEKLIPGITSHWRYPEDLFRVETNMYGRYHLNKAADFYTQAQAWAISQDPGSGLLSNSSLGANLAPASALGPAAPVQISRLDPAYLLAHLPGSTQLSFMSLQTFVPVSSTGKQQNLTAFMTASADPGDYGKLRVFATNPSETVDGPALIANAIRSNNAISSELTLLNQGGSEVILGRVDAIPIDLNLLYVEPIYVQSSSNQVPTLHDVVVVYNRTAYHSNNASLDAALCAVRNTNDGTQPFASYCNTSAANESTTQIVPPGGVPGGSTTTTTVPSGATGTTTPSTGPTTVPAPGAGQNIPSLLSRAQQAFSAADTALKAGNLAAYQADVNQAEQYVAQAQQLQGAATPPAGTTTTVAPGH